MVAVGPPCSDAGIDGADRARLGDRGSLRHEVDHGVPVCGLDAGVTEPMADRDEVDAGLKKVDGGGVSAAACGSPPTRPSRSGPRLGDDMHASAVLGRALHHSHVRLIQGECFHLKQKE
jgi:hypothetical protein